MSFGKNPHVAKAQAAEQKAQLAKDEAARTLAWRDAARQWERASERENSDTRKQEYAGRAQAARDLADGIPAENEDAPSFDAATTGHNHAEPTETPSPAGASTDRRLN